MGSLSTHKNILGEYKTGIKKKVMSSFHQRSYKTILIGSPTPPEITFMLSNMFFLLKSATLFHFTGKRLGRIFTSKDLLNYECGLYSTWSNHRHHPSPQHKIIGTYYTSNHSLAIEIDMWLTIPISRDIKILYQFYYENMLEMRHTMCWNVFYTTSLDIGFLHVLFQKIVHVVVSLASN